MKKIPFFIALIFFLFINGCNPKEKINIEQIADEIFNNIDLPFETTQNLNFQTEFVIDNKKIEVDWVTGDENIINNNGIISRDFTDQETNIKIIINYLEYKTERHLGNMKVIGYTDEEVFNIIRNNIFIPNEIIEDLDLPNSLNIYGKDFSLSWSSSNQEAISNNGKVFPNIFIQTTTLTLYAIYENITYEFDFDETSVLSIDAVVYINQVIGEVTLPPSTKGDLNLPTNIAGVRIDWFSSDSSILSNTGKRFFHPEDTIITLTAVFVYGGILIDKDYSITVITYTHSERLNLVADTIDIPTSIYGHLNLQSAYPYSVTAEWTSSDQSIINNQGRIIPAAYDRQVTLTLKLTSGEQYMIKDYNLTVVKQEKHHHILERIDDFDLDLANNLKRENNRLILNDNAIEGFYESNVFTTLNFNRLVGSWAAISSEHSTSELQIRVRVNGVWSPYLTYSPWGLGLNNGMQNQTNNISRMEDDEILILNNQFADAIQYKIILKRTSLNYPSPKLSLVSLALTIPDYEYIVDLTNIPDNYDHDVPKLYQHDIAGIGNIICSPTSATMLMMYRGETFNSDKPHGITSPLFYDHGNRIYGNWVYNTVGMSAYGHNAYVMRIYSWDELKYHLYTVGPVAVSIRGNTGLYTTNGHLMVVRGYEVVNNVTYVICNDPNVQGVYVRYTLSTFLSVTRNIIYVIE